MQARTPWLADTEPAAGLTALRDTSQVACLANDGQTGIGRRFVDLIPERPVTRLIVISPYWDHGLTALKYLMTQLAPQETILLIGPKKRLFPVDALKDLPGLRLMDISVLDPTRFFHAKAIIAQTAQADHVLFGSANCTNAALGTASSPGINEEACLYRRLPPHFSILVLSIEKLLTNEREVDRSTLEPPKLDDDINLSSLSRRDPGRFECVYDTLIWWPGQNTADDSVIELLDAERNELPGLLAPVHWQPPARRFRLPVLKDRPALARLRYADGTKSTPAIVTLADALKQSARESRNKKVEGVASLLADETNEGFWLLEALDVLEAAEDRQTDEAKTITRSRRGGDKPEPPREQYRTLNYENFIAGRQLRSDASAMVPSSLAGSELSLVRGFLKRILGVGRPDETPPDMTTEEDLSGTFDMGDETADAQGAIEGGEEFKTSPPETA